MVSQLKGEYKSFHSRANSYRVSYNIKGSDLESELKKWEAQFNHTLFGVCDGSSTAAYIACFTASETKKSDLGRLIGQVEKFCDNQNVCFPGSCN